MPRARKKEIVKADNQKKSGHLSQFEARLTRDKAEKHLKYIKDIPKNLYLVLLIY